MDKAVIRASHLNLGYDKETVVSDCSFSLPVGASLALVGVNGSGKSTLLKTLAGLVPKLSGDIQVLDRSPGKAPRDLAYHSQFHPSALILPLRAIDVVRMGRFSLLGLWKAFGPEDEKAVEAAMVAMDALDLAHEPINALSGGQRQRVFLAHALAKQGRLTLFDEPSAGLDVPGMAIFEKVLREMASRGQSYVIATHNLKEASRCDYVLLLAKKVVAYGTPEEVLTQENLLDTFGLIAQQAGDKLLVLEKDHGHDH